MAIAAGLSFVNKNSVNQTSGSVTMTTVDASSLVLCTVVTDDNGTANTISLPTASGLTFVQIGSTLGSVNNFNIAVFRAYTTSALGSTLISCSWTQSNDWVMGATDYTGTAGTSGLNGSDAIGSSNTAVGAGGTGGTVTVTSSAHNNSKYFGAIVMANSVDRPITKGASYTANVPSTFDGTFVDLLTELSTNPVTPASNTVVDGSFSGGTPTEWGDFAIELLVGTGAAATHFLSCLGAGT